MAHLRVSFHGKAILLTGETRQVKEFLKSVGGSWNPKLTGWVFPGSRKKEVLEQLHLHGDTVQDSTGSAGSADRQPSSARNSKAGGGKDGKGSLLKGACSARSGSTGTTGFPPTKRAKVAQSSSASEGKFDGTSATRAALSNTPRAMCHGVVLQTVAEFLSPGPLAAFALSSSAARQSSLFSEGSYNRVFRSVLVGGGARANNTLHMVMAAYSDEFIWKPSAERLLRLCCGKQCEMCNGRHGTLQHARADIGLFICWTCTQHSSSDVSRRKAYRPFLKHLPRRKYLWSSRQGLYEGQKVGPLITEELLTELSFDSERLGVFLAEQCVEDALMEEFKAASRQAEVLRRREEEQKYQGELDRREKKQEKKQEKSVMFDTQMLDRLSDVPWRHQALKSRFYAELMAPWRKAPSKYSKKHMSEVETCLRTSFDACAKYDMLGPNAGFGFLEEDLFSGSLSKLIKLKPEDFICKADQLFFETVKHGYPQEACVRSADLTEAFKLHVEMLSPDEMPPGPAKDTGLASWVWESGIGAVQCDFGRFFGYSCTPTEAAEKLKDAAPLTMAVNKIKEMFPQQVERLRVMRVAASEYADVEAWADTKTVAGLKYIDSWYAPHLAHEVCNGGKVGGGGRAPQQRIDLSLLEKRDYKTLLSQHIQAADRGGCFHGEGVVVLASGQQCFVRDVRAGDVVRTASGGTAHVLCTTRSPGCRELCFVGSALWVTPKHPIRIQGAWVMPQNIAACRQLRGGDVFNFVLSRGHSLLVDGIEVITMAHCGQDAAASLGHDVGVAAWGSAGVLAYLRQQPSFPDVVFHVSKCDLLGRVDKLNRLRREVVQA